MKKKKFCLVFKDGEGIVFEAYSLQDAVDMCRKKFNMVGLARFSVDDGQYTEIVCNNCDCGAFGTIPCKKALRDAEQKAA